MLYAKGTGSKPFIIQVPGASIAMASMACLHVNPGAHFPAVYVGGQKHEPHDCPSWRFRDGLVEIGGPRIYFII